MRKSTKDMIGALVFFGCVIGMILMHTSGNDNGFVIIFAIGALLAVWIDNLR